MGRRSRLCPHPSKSWFYTEAEAQATLDYIHSGRHAEFSEHIPERAYPCQCRRWHLTSQTEEENRGRQSKYK